MSRKYNLTTDAPNDTESLQLEAKVTYNNESSPAMPKNKSIWQHIKQMYFEYCSNTSIHGVQYFGQQRPWKEIFFWIIIFVISIHYCAKNIENLYDKWMEAPVIVSFSEKSTEIYKIPFPAVTICSETKRVFREGISYNELLKQFESATIENRKFQANITAIEENEFLTLLHICDPDGIQDASKIPKISNGSIDYIAMFDQMLPNFRDLYPGCIWLGNYSNCNDLFTRTYTEEGLCFTFNSLNGTDLYRENTVQFQLMGLNSFAAETASLNRTLSWSSEEGYPQKSPYLTYPARVLSSGSRASLRVLLETFKKDLDNGCRGAIQGFKVILHAPDDVPAVSQHFVSVPMHKEVVIVVKPNMFETSVKFADYDPKKRNCYLNSERQLKFFKKYSENNCELECLTNETFSKCGCVKFSMPRTPDMPVCNENKIACYLKTERDVLLKEFESKTEACNCMPSCTSLEYDTEISQADFDAGSILKALKFDVKKGDILSHLVIYFKDKEFITYKRSKLYGFSDFLANCGGVLGLFMGCSILSGIEAIYYLSLRLWSNMTRKTEIKL